MKNWNELSITDKNDIIKVAVQNGITTLPEIRERYNEFAEGGGLDIGDAEEANEYSAGGKIHIKDSKKGTFTAAASKHGMGVQAFASRVLAHPENYSPAMRKKANFARNAAKWHGLGGNLYDGESEDSQQMNVLSALIDSTKDYAKDKAKGVLKGLMSYARQAIVGDYNPVNLFRDADMWGVPEASFLMPKSWQEEEFMKNGYIKGKEGDYGLVAKAVGDRNLPIYQTAPDAVNRENLVVIDNINDRWLGDNTVGLQNPSHFPSALYSDKDGNLFQKAWDLNDYGGAGGSTAGKLGQVLDYVGNPTVVTTGFQPVVYSNFNANVINRSMAKKGLYPIMENNSLVGWGLPEVEVIGSKKGLGGPIVQAANRQ